MKPRILMTRPEPGASRTAKRLLALGYEPVIFPLTTIVPLAFEMPIGAFDALVVTSAQALRSGDFARYRGLPVFAVGDTTASAASSTGFEHITIAGGDVSSIIELVKSVLTPGARLLYVCGKVRRPDLELELSAAGFALDAVETYDAKPIFYDEEAIALRTGNEKINAVVLMSRQAAELFDGLRKNTTLGFLAKSALIVCFSQRIADGLDMDVVVTAQASEDSLVALLARHFPASLLSR